MQVLGKDLKPGMVVKTWWDGAKSAEDLIVKVELIPPDNWYPSGALAVRFMADNDCKIEDSEVVPSVCFESRSNPIDRIVLFDQLYEVR